MFGYIYLTTNLVNGKQYIGKHKSSIFPDMNYLGSGVALRRAINKYGESNFVVSLLDTADSDFELSFKETLYIIFNNAVNSELFYNCSYGGESEGWGYGSNNIAKIPKIRQINSDKHKGKKRSNETIEKQRQSMKSQPQEFRDKCSANMKKRWEDENYRQKQIEIRCNYKHLDSSKKKISKSITGSKMMYKDNIQHWIKQDEIELHLLNGWKFGSFPRDRDYSKENNGMYGKRGKDSPNYGRIFINNGYKNRCVKPNEIDDYYSQGWSYGMLPRKK